MTARARVIIDNDFAGDPDGLVQLAHHVLCTSVEVRLVVASRLPDEMVPPQSDPIAEGVVAADHVLGLAGSAVRTVPGSRTSLTSHPSSASDATDFIIREAMRRDVTTPLYYAAGAGLTELAAAYAREPAIADRLTLVWIGGHGYDELRDSPEFNTSADIAAVQIIFGSCIPIWQVPESTYSRCLFSWSELKRDIAPLGALGAHLIGRWMEFTDRIERMLGADLGETATLGDSPLVLLTALQAGFQRAPTSSDSQQRVRMEMGADGNYGAPRPDLPPVRVFTGIDTRLMYGDLIAKLAGLANGLGA